MESKTSTVFEVMEEKRDTLEGESSGDEEGLYVKLLGRDSRDVEALKAVFYGKMREGRVGEGVKYVERLIEVQPEESICHHARFRSIMVSGGGRLRPQEDSLNVPFDMLVRTPGTVMQHIDSGNLVYGAIKYLVLDEADTMFDHGFGPDIRKFLGPLKNCALNSDDQGFQTVLAMQKLVDEEFQGIVYLRTSTLHKKIASARHDFIKLSGAENKLGSLLQVLEPSLAKVDRVLVFCNTLNSSRAVDHFLGGSQIYTVNYHWERQKRRCKVPDQSTEGAEKGIGKSFESEKQQQHFISKACNFTQTSHGKAAPTQSAKRKTLVTKAGVKSASSQTKRVTTVIKTPKFSKPSSFTSTSKRGSPGVSIQSHQSRRMVAPSSPQLRSSMSWCLEGGVF
ncbi:hypothetical protein Sjap_018623 [Stephania japonica]|uniref:DEAD/DEAH-box helicase domain-containing protein n=1 Tax=Stephania japonica TaxID=461633 RepID=A0AAP0I8D2_9MAGN